MKVMRISFIGGQGIRGNLITASTEYEAVDNKLRKSLITDKSLIIGDLIITGSGKVYKITGENQLYYIVGDSTVEIEGRQSFVQYQEVGDFPNKGSETVLYLSTEESILYRWDKNEGYVPLSRYETIEEDDIENEDTAAKLVTGKILKNLKIDGGVF